jgi:exopolysaccharide production protein ExoZ
MVREQALAAGALFVGYSVLVLRALTPGTRLAEIFSIGPLRWLGNMSYSFYLVHGLPLHAFGIAAGRLALTRLTPHVVWAIFLVAYPVVFLATAACAAILFLVVEKRVSLVSKSPKTTTVSPVALLGEPMQVQTE